MKTLFSNLTMPNRILSYEKIMKVEGRKTSSLDFYAGPFEDNTNIARAARFLPGSPCRSNELIRVLFQTAVTEQCVGIGVGTAELAVEFHGVFAATLLEDVFAEGFGGSRVEDTVFDEGIKASASSTSAQV